MAKFIEFVGLPGAGKTSIGRRLLAVEPLLPHSKLPRPRRLKMVISCGKLLFRGLTQSSSRQAKVLCSAKGRGLFLKLAYRHAALSDVNEPTWLVDSGVYQPVVSFCAEICEIGFPDDLVSFFFDLAKLESRLVFVDVSCHEAYRRYRHREASEGVRDGCNATNESFIFAHRTLNDFINRLDRKDVFKVNNEYTVDDNEMIELVEFVKDSIR